MLPVLNNEQPIRREAQRLQIGLIQLTALKSTAKQLFGEFLVVVSCDFHAAVQ